MTDRVIALIDMDCFYCQVETRLNPDLKGLPLAVVQYNEWKGGGIIAVNYEARDRGVTRHMRGHEAKAHCPEIILARVPMLREKADLSRYRDAGREVIAVLCTFSDCVERASVDEAYVDLTAAVNKKIAESSAQISNNDLQNTYVVGYTTEGSNNEEERLTGLNSWLNDIYDTSFQDVAAQKLAVGALIIEEMRRAVYEKTGFRCSAGIAHNKILAKLACGLHKPNRQTVIPQSSVPSLYKNLPAKKVRSLGGKLGDNLTERLGIKVMADLSKFSESELQKVYDTKTGTWLYNIARGYDYDPVNPRLISKSIGCRKNFPGRTALANSADIQHWVAKLAEELLERLNEDNAMNKRRAQLLTVSMGLEINNRDIASSKSSPLTSYNLEKIITIAHNILSKTCVEDSETKIWSPPIKYLGLSAGKFVNESANKIINFFKNNQKFDRNSKSSLALSAEKIPCSKETINFLNSNETCDEIAQNCLEMERSSSVGKVTPQNVINMSRVNEKVSDTPKNGNKQLSFFEKMLLQEHSNTETKLNILPVLNKSDLLNQGENSLNFGTSSAVNDAVVDSVQREIEQTLKKEESSVKNSPLKSKLNSRTETNSASKSNKMSISSFFSSNTIKDKWINPEEIFPNLNEIDDNIIEMFPLSFKKKIMDLKRASNFSSAKSFNINQKPSCSSVEAVQEKSVVNDDVMLKKNFQRNTDDEETSDTDMFDNHFEYNEYFKCNECEENIPIKERETHLDLHIAIKLDSELNQVNAPLVSKKLKNFSSKNHRTKRKIKNNDISKVTKKPKGIEAFFSK